MTQPAGWFHDPYGRYQQRYWNGTEWTEHVSTDGVQAVDPLGVTTVIPIVTPASAYTAPTVPAAAATAGTGQPRRFLDSLGPDGRERPAPRLSIALAGGGGALVAAGIVAAIVGDNGSRASGIGAALLILFVALPIRLANSGAADLKSAAVGAGVIGLLTLGVSIVTDDVAEAWALFIVGALFLAAWVLPGFRGRPIMLGIGTLLWIGALGAATGSSDANDGGPFADVPFRDAVGDQEVVFLLAAAVLFGLVWWLDRAGYHGVATGLIVAALVSAFVGVGEASSNLDDTGAAVLIVVVGLLVCFVGSHGTRRATTWWGAVLATIGVVAFFASVLEPDSIGSISATLLISGILLAAGPALVRAIRAGRGRSQPPDVTSANPSLPPPVV